MMRRSNEIEQAATLADRGARLGGERGCPCPDAGLEVDTPDPTSSIVRRRMPPLLL